jgi:poly-beta-1,6 N-acetyl-D-glucosamine synthase
MVQKRKNKVEKPPLNEQPLVSIIVPAYNEEVNILRTIENLLKTEYKNIEIVFVDDGSRDNTYSLVTEKFSTNPNVKIYTKQNGGKASALNYGISMSNAEYVVCIDADTQLKPDAVTELIKYFDDEKVGAIAGNVKVGNHVNMLTNWQSVEYITSQNFDRRAFDLLNGIMVVPGAIGAFRKSALIKVGKFSTDTLAEDCEITIRLLMEGCTVKYSHTAISYTESPETLKMFIKQRFRWTYGIMQSVWKHKETVFNRNYKGLGLAAMPNAMLFQFMLPVISPLVDFVMLLSLISGQWFQTLMFYLVFTIVDLLASVLAFSYEKENIKKLLYLIPQRLVYRQLMFWVLLKSILAALRGTLIGWGVLKRTGTVKLAN